MEVVSGEGSVGRGCVVNWTSGGSIHNDVVSHGYILFNEWGVMGYGRGERERLPMGYFGLNVNFKR